MPDFPSSRSPGSPVWAYSLQATLCLMVPFDLLASLGMDIYLPVVPQMPTALATTPTLVQYTLSAYILLIGLGQLLFGPLSDRVGRRPVLLSGAALFAMSSFALAAAHSGAVFLALRVLQALGASAALVATFATVRDVYAERPEATTLYGWFSAILAFVPALGPVLGALIALAGGWRAIFAVLGGLTCVALWRAWPRWHETRPARQRDAGGTSVGAILRNKAFIVFTLGFSAGMGTFFVFLSTAPRVLVGVAGYSPLAFSLAFAAVALIMVCTTRFVARLAQAWGTAGCFKIGNTVMLVGAALIALGMAAGAPPWLSFLLPMGLMSVGIIFTVSVTANGALRDFGHQAGAAVALYYSLQSTLSAGIGTLLITCLGGDTALPLLAYGLLMPSASLLAWHRWLGR